MYEGVVGWEGVGEYSCHSGTDSGVMFSVGDRDVHNPQDSYRSRWTLAAVGTPPTLISAP